MKKTSKKAKKVLTKRFLSGILCKLPQGNGKSCKKELEKRFGKIEKTLDKQISASYNNQAVAAEAATREKVFSKKSSKKINFLLTNSKQRDIIIKLSPERASKECTLKIEQCKKKLMLNKHQKRVQVLRDTLTKISFES